jgi:hypothetical protein
VLSKLLSRLIVFGGVLATLTVGAITLTLFKLPKPAAAQQSIDPAILTTHLQKLRGDLALP